MIRHSFSAMLLLSVIFIFQSCTNNSSEPTDTDQFEIIADPVSAEFKVSPDSLQTESFPDYSIEYSNLNSNEIGPFMLSNYWSNLDVDIKKEFVIALNDSFAVEILNCSKVSEWVVSPQMIFEIDVFCPILEVVLLRTERNYNTDSTVNFRFIFKAEKPGKGFLCFNEIRTNNEPYYDKRELIVGYSINPISNLFLETDEVKWTYYTAKGSFSRVSIIIKGRTNAYRTAIINNGDGIATAHEIKIQQDGSFDITSNVAFSHVEGQVLTSNTELVLYGTVGLPRIIPLQNPKSDK